MNRCREALGDLCELVKGTSPISKTPPGAFPLVTTSEERKSAGTFQFDAEAVCIPLISSTGHGHASLKRILYQRGKFALGSILAAAVVRDPSRLSTKFLARYLTFAKDRLIVPLMTGAANMSIGLDRLATVPVVFPSLGEQCQIVSFLDELDEVQALRSVADRQTAALVPAIFSEMFGDPNRGALWPTVPLKEVGRIVTGNTPPRADPANFGNFIAWVKTDNIDVVRRIVTQPAEGLSRRGAAIGRTVPAGSVLITCIAGSRDRIGDAAVVTEAVAINQQINAIVPGSDFEPHFVGAMIGALKPSIQARVAGNMTGIVNKGSLERIRAIHSPKNLQHEFAERVVLLESVEEMQAYSRESLRKLVGALTHAAFSGTS
jgi:type I restriction enzyme S subunit